MAPSAGISASPTYLPQKQASAPSWKLDPEEYRERQVADRIVDVKSKESFSADDRLIRQYEQEVMKQFEECVNRIPTGDETVRSLFEKACSLDDEHKHYDDFQWYNRFREDRIRDTVYRRFLLTTDEEIAQRNDQYQKEFKKFYARQGFQVNMSYAQENERIYRDFRSSVLNIMKSRQEKEEMEKKQQHL